MGHRHLLQARVRRFFPAVEQLECACNLIQGWNSGHLNVALYSAIVSNCVSTRPGETTDPIGQGDATCHRRMANLQVRAAPNVDARTDPIRAGPRRAKAYRRLLPLLFVCYTIAYVDRVNVGIAKLTMSRDLPAFNDEVIGFGAGVFFIGYFLLEIPGALIVECWSARKWISRIMVVVGDHGRPDGVRDGSPGISMRSGSCWASPRPGSSPG